MFWSFLHQLSGNKDRLPKSRPWSECWTIEENKSSTVLKVLKTHWTANWKTAEKAKKSFAERLSHNAPLLDAVIPLGQLIAGKNISNTLLQVGNSWWATTIRPDPTAINTSMSLERPGGFLYLSSETDPALRMVRMVRRRAKTSEFFNPPKCWKTLELNLIYGYPKMIADSIINYIQNQRFQYSNSWMLMNFGWLGVAPYFRTPLLYVNQNQHENNMSLCSSPLLHKIIRAAYRKLMLRGGIFCGIFGGQTLWTADNMDTVWLKIVAITKTGRSLPSQNKTCSKHGFLQFI